MVWRCKCLKFEEHYSSVRIVVSILSLVEEEDERTCMLKTPEFVNLSTTVDHSHFTFTFAKQCFRKFIFVIRNYPQLCPQLFPPCAQLYASNTPLGEPAGRVLSWKFTNLFYCLINGNAKPHRGARWRAKPESRNSAKQFVDNVFPRKN